MARIIDEINLCLLDRRSGGHVYMNLNTGKQMVQPNIKTIPITDSVIEQVKIMSLDQEIKEVQFYNRVII